MARGINRVILVGNLGDDPETKYTQGGMAVTTIRLATTSVRKDKDGQTPRAHRLAPGEVLRKLGEIAGEYLRKGSQCYVEGSIRYDKYTGQDGVEKYTTDIIATRCRCSVASPTPATVAEAVLAVVRRRVSVRSGRRSRRARTSTRTAFPLSRSAARSKPPDPHLKEPPLMLLRLMLWILRLFAWPWAERSCDRWPAAPREMTAETMQSAAIGAEPQGDGPCMDCATANYPLGGSVRLAFKEPPHGT
jgi:single-strand DNA-binding protein